MLDAIGQIHAQHVDRCSADRGFSAKYRSVPRKVLVPIVGAWIEERLPAVWIKDFAKRMSAKRTGNAAADPLLILVGP